MKTSVYLITGENLPPKLAVVAFELEHDVLLEMENRFLGGAKYTTLTPVHKGVVRLASPIFGRYDQAYFSGRDNARLDAAGGTDVVASDSEPGAVIPMDEGEYTSRIAYLMERVQGDVAELLVVVVQEEEWITAAKLAEAFAGMPGVASLDVKRIGCGTFCVHPDVARMGFKVRVAPAHQY